MRTASRLCARANSKRLPVQLLQHATFGAEEPGCYEAETLAMVEELGLQGKVFTSGTGLPADRDIALTWGTANVDWVLDARADSVDYLGRKATKFAVRLATNVRAIDLPCRMRRKTVPKVGSSPRIMLSTISRCLSLI